MATQRYRISHAAELESLAKLRQFIRDCCARAAIQEEVVFDLTLAVDEACTNIITHGYAGMDAGSIILSFWIESDGIRVQITDFGHAFEPADSPKPDVEAALEDRELGGLGLFLIYQTMDRIDYRASAAGNHLTFTRYF
jgi:serine/threonine-protein kinase RsbW